MLRRRRAQTLPNWIARHADAVSLDRMKDEVETFVAALRHDLIDASDFGR